MRPLYILAFLSLCAPSLTFAQSPAPTCPIAFVQINPTGSDSMGAGLFQSDVHADDGRMFVLKLRNDSSKEIEGMKFQAAYLDATDDEQKVPDVWEWTKAVKPGAEGTFRWRNEWSNDAIVGWNVHLTKVLFSDGSTWMPTSTSDCEGTFQRKKHHW